jgi:hypothetical protein
LNIWLLLAAEEAAHDLLLVVVAQVATGPLLDLR